VTAEDKPLDEFLSGGVVVLCAHTDFDGDGDFFGDIGHAAEDVL
jgi:hypothetical protein